MVLASRIELEQAANLAVVEYKATYATIHHTRNGPSGRIRTDKNTEI